MEKSEFWIQLLKSASIIIASTLGVIGIMMDLKNPKGHLTNGGKTVLAIIIISTLIGLTTQLVEFIKDQKETKRLLKVEKKQNRKTTLIIKQNTKVLKNVLRSVNLIDEFTVFFDINFPLEEGYAKKYNERISKLKSNLKITKIGESAPFRIRPTNHVLENRLILIRSLPYSGFIFF